MPGRGHSVIVEKNVDGILYANRIRPDVPNGLNTWIYPGYNSLDLSRRDFATGGLLPVVGAPVAGPNFISCRGHTNYLISNMSESAAMTVQFWARRTDTSADAAHQGVVLGSFAGSVVPYLGLVVYFATATALRAQAYQVDGTSRIANVTPVGGSNLWKRYTLILDPGTQSVGNYGSVTIRCETDATAQTSTVFSGARLLNGYPVQIGSAPSASFQANVDVGPLVMRNVVLTDPQIAATWAQMAVRAQLDGLVENT